MKILDAARLERVNKQMRSSLSPKFTKINLEDSIRSSRSGRPQKIRQLESNYIPTDVLLYVTKSNPKKQKPKIVQQLDTSPNMTKFPQQPLELIDNKYPHLILNKITDENPLESEKKISRKKKKLTKKTLNNSTSKPRKSLRTLVNSIMIDTQLGIQINDLEINNEENLVPQMPHIIDSEIPAENDSISTKKIKSRKATKKIFKTKKSKSILDISEQKPPHKLKKTSLITQFIKKEQLTESKIKEELIETSLKEELTDILKTESEVIKDEPMDFEDDSFKELENNKSKDKLDFSDTDSAKGSSIADSTTPAPKDFNAGQILWGSNSKNSYYPCMVYPNAEGLTITSKLK